MARTAPFPHPVSGAGHGFVVRNTFLIKPGNEQGTRVVHATPGHGAGTGLLHHQFLPGLTLADPSCPVTIVSAPLGHPGPKDHPGVALSGTSQAVTHWWQSQSPGCGSCVTVGGSSTSPGCWWPFLALSVCPALLPAPTSGSGVTPAPSAPRWGWALPDKASRLASAG